MRSWLDTHLRVSGVTVKLVEISAGFFVKRTRVSETVPRGSMSYGGM